MNNNQAVETIRDEFTEFKKEVAMLMEGVSEWVKSTEKRLSVLEGKKKVRTLKFDKDRG